MVFYIGIRVVKNPETWAICEFDLWGRGKGIGIVVEPPFELEDDMIDVRWPNGRCFENIREVMFCKE